MGWSFCEQHLNNNNYLGHAVRKCKQATTSHVTRGQKRYVHACNRQHQVWLPAYLFSCHNRELKQRRFWATHINRKWSIFPFNMPLTYKNRILQCLFSYGDNLLENVVKITPFAKRLLLVDVHHSQTLLLKLRKIFNSAISTTLLPSNRKFKN